MLSLDHVYVLLLLAVIALHRPFLSSRLDILVHLALPLRPLTISSSTFHLELIYIHLSPCQHLRIILRQRALSLQPPLRLFQRPCLDAKQAH